MHTFAERRIFMLRPEEILLPQGRGHREYDSYELHRLADSISANGLVEPISVRKTERGYELIAGERRLLACRIALLRRVPCILHRIDSLTADCYALVENLHQCTPNYFVLAEQIDALLQQHRLTQTEVAIRLGLSQSTLDARLRLLHLSEDLRHRIIDAGLGERYARLLLRLPAERRNEALDKILAEGYTLRQSEMLVGNLLHPVSVEPQPAPITEEEPPEPPVRKMAIGDVRLFTNSLNKLVNTLQAAGVPAQTRRYENENYVEYRVRIRKEPPQPTGRQLKIC